MNRSEPRAHWLLLTLGMVVLLGELCLAGYVNHVGAEGIGPRPPAAGREPAPAQVLAGGPVLRIDGDRQVTSRSMPANAVALTFDDGPDPQWTPMVLDALARHGAHATIFVIGSKVNREPGADPTDRRRRPRTRRAHLHPRGVGGRARVAKRPGTDTLPDVA